MSNEDATVWIVFNGEIYNFQDLKKELLLQGHRFKSDHSDTEVLLHLYEQKSTEMFSRLNGMFAFVLYDKKKQLLFGARDRLGIKPLYYIYKNSFFSFASELKTLLLLPQVSKEIDQQALYDYMSLQFIPAPRSIFRDVRKLPAAHYFIFDIKSKSLKIRKYWDVPQSSDGRMRLDDAVDLIRQQTQRAVLAWSVSDVPLACSLSGGIDSSTIVGLLCSLGLKHLKTFSLGFRDKKESFFDERHLAQKTSQRWGTSHYETVIEPDDLLDDLEQMVWHLDEPYGGGLPSWYIFKSMRGKVKVALTGTGGDELFGVYGYWRPYESLLWRLRQIAKTTLLDNFYPNTFFMMRTYPHGYLYHRYFTDIMKRKFLFNKETLDTVESTEACIQRLWNRAKGRSPRDAVAYIHFKMQLPEEFLHMTDRFSMAHSIEARTPLLDHNLVESVMSIPGRIRTSPKNLKYLFIKAMKDVLIDEVINAPKRGFVLPLDRWLRGPLRRKVEHSLGEAYLKKQGLFNKDFYHSIVKPYLKGRRYLDDFIWTVFMFQMWYRRFIEDER
jgi:asparagine synthase (glutamine-hydrolysing)